MFGRSARCLQCWSHSLGVVMILCGKLVLLLFEQKASTVYLRGGIIVSALAAHDKTGVRFGVAILAASTGVTDQ